MKAIINLLFTFFLIFNYLSIFNFEKNGFSASTKSKDKENAPIIDVDNFNDPYLNRQRYLEMTGVYKVWDLYNPVKKIKIAVFDNGIEENSVELEYSLNKTLSKSFHPNYVSPFTVENDLISEEDVYNHGTGIANIIAAKQDNDFGISGIINNVELISIRVSNGNGQFVSASVLADAIDYCNNIGVDIINLSCEGYTYSSRLLQSIKNFSGLVVCAAGNTGSNLDEYPTYPACFDSDNLITVGAVDVAKNIASYGEDGASSFGKNSVDLFAPGKSIYSAFVNNEFNYFDGTSFAVPIVVGIAAMYYSTYPDTSIPELKEIISDNVWPRDSLANRCKSGGIVNAYSLFHTHGDYSYEWINSKQHNVICECGYDYLSYHIIGEISGERSQCILCGGLADSGFITPTSITNDIFETVGDKLFIKESAFYNDILFLSFEDYIKYLEDSLL